MLTPAQLTALRVACFADPAAAALIAAGDANGLHAFLNEASTFVVWRTAVGKDEITQNGFDWTRLDNLSVGKARVWDGLFDNANRTMNPAKLNVRAGIETVWVGTAADLAVRAQVYVHCKRFATRGERMLGSGTGTDAVPGVLTYEGEISPTDATRVVYKDDGTIWTAQG